MITLNEKLTQSGFVASEAQIEALAVGVANGEELAGSYLRILCVAIQAKLGRGKRKVSAESQVSAVNEIHGDRNTGFLGAVCRGLLHAGPLPADVLMSRARFALSAASALRRFAAEGGDIRALNAATLTRRQVRPERGDSIPVGTSRTEATMLRAQARILSVAERLGKKDAPEARRLLEEIIDALSSELDKLADGNAEVPTTTIASRVVSHALRRQGANQPQAQYHKAA